MGDLPDEFLLFVDLEEQRAVFLRKGFDLVDVVDGLSSDLSELFFDGLQLQDALGLFLSLLPLQRPLQSDLLNINEEKDAILIYLKRSVLPLYFHLQLHVVLLKLLYHAFSAYLVVLVQLA